MDSRGHLTPYISRIQAALSEVERRASEVVPDIVLDIEVEAVRFGGVPETGHSGYVPRPGLMRLMLDPENQNLEHHLGLPLETMIAHELHHALRWDTVGYGDTLLEALTSEGLCGRFANELYGNEPEPWERALTEEQLERVLLAALKQGSDTAYDHNEWFFGNGIYPKWAGYTLGYRMVKKYTEQTGSTPSTLVSTDASEFIGALNALVDR